MPDPTTAPASLSDVLDTPIADPAAPEDPAAEPEAPEPALEAEPEAPAEQPVEGEEPAEPAALAPPAAKVLGLEGVTEEDLKATLALYGVTDKASLDALRERGGRVHSHFQSLHHKSLERLAQQTRALDARIKEQDALVEQRAAARAAELAKTYSEIPEYPGIEQADGLPKEDWDRFHRLRNKANASDPVYQNLQKLLSEQMLAKKTEEQRAEGEKLNAEFTALDNAAFSAGGLVRVDGSAPIESAAIPPEVRHLPPMIRHLLVGHVRTQAAEQMNHAMANNRDDLRPTPDAIRDGILVAAREFTAWFNENYVLRKKPTTPAGTPTKPVADPRAPVPPGRKVSGRTALRSLPSLKDF